MKKARKRYKKYLLDTLHTKTKYGTYLKRLAPATH